MTAMAPLQVTSLFLFCFQIIIILNDLLLLLLLLLLLFWLTAIKTIALN